MKQYTYKGIAFDKFTLSNGGFSDYAYICSDCAKKYNLEQQLDEIYSDEETPAQKPCGITGCANNADHEVSLVYSVVDVITEGKDDLVSFAVTLPNGLFAVVNIEKPLISGDIFFSDDKEEERLLVVPAACVNEIPFILPSRGVSEINKLAEDEDITELRIRYKDDTVVDVTFYKNV